MLKKLFIALLAICMSATMFTSCGDKDKDKDEEETTQTNSKSWDSLVKSNSWLANYPKPVDKYAYETTQSVGDDMKMIAIYVLTSDSKLSEEYEAKLEAEEFDMWGKEIDGYSYSAAVENASAEGQNLTMIVFYRNKDF